MILTAATPHAPWAPERRSTVARMQSEADAAGVQLTVCTDPPEQSAINPLYRSGWPNTRRAWEAGRDAGTHHLVMEDDVYLADHFFDAVRSAVDVLPDNAISFYCNYVAAKGIDTAVARGDHWATTPGPCMWGQALLIPSAWIDDYLAFDRRWFDDAYKMPDTRFGLWNYDRHRLIWVSVPSIVEHGDAPSLCRHYEGTVAGRGKHGYLVDLEDARRHDWSLPAGKPAHISSAFALPHKEGAYGPYVRYTVSQRSDGGT